MFWSFSRRSRKSYVSGVMWVGGGWWAIQPEQQRWSACQATVIRTSNFILSERKHWKTECQIWYDLGFKRLAWQPWKDWVIGGQEDKRAGGEKAESWSEGHCHCPGENSIPDQGGRGWSSERRPGSKFIFPVALTRFWLIG